MSQRFALALDLKDDPGLIAEYERHHQNVWPEIERAIRASGIQKLEIYRTGTRLFMIIEAKDSFSFEAKGEADSVNPTVLEWETLMWAFQQPLPWARPGEKWVLMDRIYDLKP